MPAPSSEIAAPAQPVNPAEPIVSFENVSIAFDEKVVLEDISFTVHLAETRIILGPAGCGKSVLMKLTNGLIKPDSGIIKVFGEDVTVRRRRLQQGGMRSGTAPALKHAKRAGEQK